MYDSRRVPVSVATCCAKLQHDTAPVVACCTSHYAASRCEFHVARRDVARCAHHGTQVPPSPPEYPEYPLRWRRVPITSSWHSKYPPVSYTLTEQSCLSQSAPEQCETRVKARTLARWRVVRATCHRVSCRHVSPCGLAARAASCELLHQRSERRRVELVAQLQQRRAFGRDLRRRRLQTADVLRNQCTRPVGRALLPRQRATECGAGCCWYYLEYP